MNFFNSIFSDDRQPSNDTDSPHPDLDSENPTSPDPNPDPSSKSTSQASTSIWSFGSLIKSVATKSESMIGNYRRDIEEFGSGLLKETAAIRDVASRAVKEFPDSIDSGAAVAQESLESVGQAIDNLGSSVWKGTTKIIASSKELRFLHDNDGDDENYTNENDDNQSMAQLSERSLNSGKYSRSDVRIREIQCDLKTYDEEPEDSDDYREWKLGFVLNEKDGEIEKLIGENRVIEKIYMQLVPSVVDRDEFWGRYFYRVYKHKQAEEARARIVRRAISGEDEEVLSWDVEDDDDAEGSNHLESEGLRRSVADESNLARRASKIERDDNNGGEPSSSDRTSSQKMELKRPSSDESRNEEVKESASSEVPAVDNGESCKDSDVSIVSTQPSLLPSEEELGWDEIEDIESDEDNKALETKNANISDLRKRLTAAEEEEDLSWDIEDDDEPVKS
ncbi:hypothetical protein Nepgr_030296 [Nepenthes gracilis]|uniref:BSD domain-containing protein n=1 Tax=Nepenthes gracilis TaxID=150966 RepID=A0AAD3Y426_NEPGR|nr:hypothetical protein Nepgr_030296 [Nepenthes gracilis]